MDINSIWHITREYRGIAEAGGIKDVVRDLSEALTKFGLSVSVIIPFYGFMDNLPLMKINEFNAGGSGQAIQNRIEVFSFKLNGVNIYCLKTESFSAKEGVYTYTEREAERNPHYRKGEGHEDAVTLSLIFQRTAVEFLRLTGEKPSIVHCHDAHAACVPAIMREIPEFSDFFAKTACVVTIHNAGPGYHQEFRDVDLASRLTGLPSDVLHTALLHGAVNPFLLAARYAVTEYGFRKLRPGAYHYRFRILLLRSRY